MKFIIIAWIFFCSAVALAAGFEPVISVPAEPQPAGRETRLTVYLHNTGEQVVVMSPPERLTCLLSAKGWSEEVAAFAVGAEAGTVAVMPAGGFVKRQYAFTVPETLSGAVRLSIPEFGGAAVMFSVAVAPPAAAAGSPETAETEAREIPTLDELQMLYQPYLVNFAAYEPMYFLVGADPAKSKFQVSFKYRFFNPDSEMAAKHPLISGLHFAYTQTSFWDLRSDSQPFEDTSYKPELFFQSPNIDTGLSWVRGFFMQPGFQHESNGRGGDLSRSTNTLYLKSMFVFYDNASRFGLLAVPKVWVYVANSDDTNADLKDYRGFFDLGLKFGKADDFVLGSHFRWAEEGRSFQLDFTYPLHQYIFKDLDLYFQVQYVDALAESLLDFRERTRALRLGFAIVR